MPVFSRKQLRRALGQSHIRDTLISSTTASWEWWPGSINIIDRTEMWLDASGQGLFRGAVLRVEGAAAPSVQDVRVATFNVASGAYVSTDLGTVFAHLIASGTVYERHEAVPPADKDHALNDAVHRVLYRSEVPLGGGVGGARYPVPDEVVTVLDAYAFASPDAADRGRVRVRAFETVLTGSGREVRVDPAVGGSAQLVLDALVTPTLGSADEATVAVPDARLVLYAAEAKCWDLMVRKAPRGTADEYRRLRDEAARQFTLLASRYKAPVDRPLRPDGPAY